jgi:cation diffusion facilitator CzcD-associated flavoprotein CzcO
LSHKEDDPVGGECNAPIAQLAEAADLKSAKCRFESDWGHGKLVAAHKARMLEDVPNLVWCIGYAGLSWTLRADMTARSVAKLLAYMNSRGYTSAYPHRGTGTMPASPVLS